MRNFNSYNNNLKTNSIQNENLMQSDNNFLTIQNCREDIIGELDAIIQYEKHIEMTDDSSAKATILDIVNEEKLHVGQLFGLLFKLDPTSQTQFEKGYNEFIDNDDKNYY